MLNSEMLSRQKKKKVIWNKDLKGHSDRASHYAQVTHRSMSSEQEYGAAWVEPISSHILDPLGLLDPAGVTV